MSCANCQSADEDCLCGKMRPKQTVEPKDQSARADITTLCNPEYGGCGETKLHKDTDYGYTGAVNNGDAECESCGRRDTLEVTDEVSTFDPWAVA